MKITPLQYSRLKSLLEAIADNDPNETISDSGQTVWDLIKHDSIEYLKSLENSKNKTRGVDESATMISEHKGWVIIGIGSFIIPDSFHHTRREAIAWLIKGSDHTWKYWYNYGLRCVKATKTIETN